jgi:acyl carrier protein
METRPNPSPPLSEILSLLEPFNPRGIEIDENTEFVDGLALDSVAVMELLVAVEDRFDITVPLNLLPAIRTVGELAAAVDAIRQDSHAHDPR